MGLALKEMLRERGRFAAVVTAVGLICVLLLFLTSQLDGLYRGQTGVLRSQDAELVVYQSDVDRSLFRSSVPLADASLVARVPGVRAVGAVGALFGAVRAVGGGRLVDMGLFGFQPGRPGTPATLVAGRLPRPGEGGVGAVDESARRQGIGVGARVRFGGASGTIRVVGLVKDSTLALQPVLWVDLGVWRTLRGEVRPERAGGPPDANLFFVDVDRGASPAAVARRIDIRAPGVEALSVAEAVDSLPGLAAQNQSFALIIGLTYVAAAIVVTLFFALLTLQKTELIGVLKALGAGSGLLARSLASQGVLIAVAGYAGAVVFTLGLAGLVGGSLPFHVSLRSWLTVGGLIVAVALLGAALAFRRIARIDPASAVGGGR